MYDCPSCDYTSETRQGVSVHHSLVHGESLLTEETECEVCGSTFEYYPSEKDGVYCSDCVDNSWGNENLIVASGEDNANWNGGASKLVTTECDNCGVEISRRLCDVENREVNLCSKECKSEWAKDRYSGKSNPMWKGGFHKKWYNNKKWKDIRDKAKERDGYECQRCGCEEMLDVHHIKPVREFEDYLNAHTMDNVVTLCRSCHRKVEVGEATI